MEKTLRLLIEDDLKITRLVRTLGKLEIDATQYLTNTSTIVFHLLGIPQNDPEDHRYDEYFQLIERSATVANTPEQLRQQALEIVHTVLNWQKELNARAAC